MAKHPVGLPENFSLNVSKEDLQGPAKLPDYLDSDPLLEQLKRAARPQASKAESHFPFRPAASQEPESQAAKTEEALKKEPQETSSRLRVLSAAAAIVEAPKEQTVSPIGEERVSAKASTATSLQQSAQARESEESAKKPAPRRLQINLSAEAERKVGELIELLNAQSPEKINISDLAQGLILSLYDARGEINVSRLPTRGKWGTPTARSFPTALAQALREAIVTYNSKQGGNPFKKVVGE